MAKAKRNTSGLVNLANLPTCVQREIQEKGRKAAAEKKKQNKEYSNAVIAYGKGEYLVDGKPIKDPTTGRNVTRLMKTIDTLYELALEDKEIRAIEDILKVHGLLTDKIEHTGRGGDPIQLQAIAPQPLTTEQIVEAKLRLEAEIAETTDTDD